MSLLQRCVGLTLVIAVGALCSASTATRVRIWQDEAALWGDATQKAPFKPKAWNNLGNALASLGQAQQARRAYETATRTAESPVRLRDERAYGIAISQANLAMMEADSGQLKEAVARLAPVVAKYTVTSVLAAQRWLEHRLASMSP